MPPKEQKTVTHVFCLPIREEGSNSNIPVGKQMEFLDSDDFPTILKGRALCVVTSYPVKRITGDEKLFEMLIATDSNHLWCHDITANELEKHVPKTSLLFKEVWWTGLLEALIGKVHPNLAAAHFDFTPKDSTVKISLSKDPRVPPVKSAIITLEKVTGTDAWNRFMFQFYRGYFHAQKSLDDAKVTENKARFEREEAFKIGKEAAQRHKDDMTLLELKCLKLINAKKERMRVLKAEHEKMRQTYLELKQDYLNLTSRARAFQAQKEDIAAQAVRTSQRNSQGRHVEESEPEPVKPAPKPRQTRKTATKASKATSKPVPLPISRVSDSSDEGYSKLIRSTPHKHTDRPSSSPIASPIVQRRTTRSAPKRPSSPTSQSQEPPKKRSRASKNYSQMSDGLGDMS